MFSTRVSYAVISAFILLSIMASCAHAELYGLIGIGRGKAQLSQGTADGGIAWQQKGFPHHEGLTNTIYHIGLGYNFSRTWAAEIRYKTGMSVTAYGQWTYNDDGSKISNGPVTGEGGAHVQGVSLAGLGRYHFTPDISAGLEAGAFLWDSAWRMRITDSCGNSFTHDPVKTRGLGSLMGVVMSYQQFDLRYEMFHVEPRDGNFNIIKEININYRF